MTINIAFMTICGPFAVIHVDNILQHDAPDETVIVSIVQSRVKQVTSRLKSCLNSVDNKLVERLMINDERRNMISFHDNSLIIHGIREIRVICVRKSKYPGWYTPAKRCVLL